MSRSTLREIPRTDQASVQAIWPMLFTWDFKLYWNILAKTIHGRGGLLEISKRALYATADGILAVLYFYSKLFFALPLARLVVFVVCCNYCFVRRRNERRAGVASELSC